MREEILLADLTQGVPADAFSLDGQPGTWMTLDYETDEGKGVMLLGLPRCEPPQLRLPLNATGWHRIQLGIYYGATAGIIADRVLLAKLTHDPCFSHFRKEDYQRKDGEYPERAFTWSDLVEVFWKCADLTGQDLVIARPPEGSLSECEANLAYIRLTPMDEADLDEWRAEQPRPETKRLIANYDAAWRHRRTWTREDFREEFSTLAQSDFDIVLRAAARGPVTLYPSRVGEVVRPTGLHGSGHIPYDCIRSGIDPLAEALDAAHELGLKLFPQLRFVGTQLPPMHVREDHGGKLMADHPEWLCAYPDGEPTRHLSLAFPEVRQFYVRLLREWVEDYHADGTNVIFSRSAPFVYYEQPVCDAFRETYDADMRTLPSADERVMQARADFVTQFLREVRAMLDGVGEAQGRHIPSSYIVPTCSSFGDVTQEIAQTALGLDLFNSLDVAAWIREGLVDCLNLQASCFREHDGAEVQPRIREFTELTKGTKTKVFVDVYPRRMPPRQYRKIAISYYEAGADGLSFWDTPTRHGRASEWAFIKRLGHREDLERWDGKADDDHRVVPLRRLDGYAMGREFTRPTDG